MGAHANETPASISLGGQKSSICIAPQISALSEYIKAISIFMVTLVFMAC
jgi:hypothetical protein